MYALLKALLFRLDPETAHNMTVAGLRRLAGHPALLRAMDTLFTVEDPRLHVRFKTLECRNPVGLAAGFDKAAELADVLPHLGFGFIETGTFTPLLQEGRDKPRLFRYPSHEAVVNRMGFNNPGVMAAAERLAEGAPRRLPLVPVGANIGKGKATPPEEAVEDYATAFRHVLPVGDYFVLNVSSPNTPNLRNLQEVASLRVILERLTAMNRAWSQENAKPAKWILTKVAPDCHPDQLDEIARLAVETGTGLVATNTTIDHAALGDKAGESGGLSGRPLTGRSTDVIRRLYGVTRGVVPIIGVGGVFSAEDAYAKIRAGADLVQIYTGWIYRGPGLVPAINRGLLRLLERDRFKNVMEAVGTAKK